MNEMAETIDWRDFDESTSLSWLWAFICGPLYFAWHGFWGRAVLVFILNLMLIGFILAPFLAYPAWRERAKAAAQAERMVRALEGRV
jgi:hypothetical protein